MNLKGIFKSVVIAGVLLSPLCAGELKVKNNAKVTVSVTVRAKENKSPTTPFIVTQIVQPDEEITITLDEKKLEGTTFSVQGTTVGGPNAVPLTSNECVLCGCKAKVVFKSKSDGSALVCGVTQTNG